MITCNNVQKAFGKNQVLQGIDLDFRESGRITAILGPNGSGKTTLIKSILGMVLPEQGSITVNEQPVRKQWAYRSAIDYLPQIARFPENLTVSELMSMIKDIRPGASRDQELINRFGLKPFLRKRLGNLSGGTKQKVNITLAMMYDSPILIFDEPTSGLDPVAMQTLKALIQEEKERGKLILVTTHIMQFVEEVADEIVFLLEGKTYFRGPIQALKDRVGVDDLEAAIAGILREHPIVVASPDTTRRISANPIRRKIPGLLTSFKKA